MFVLRGPPGSMARRQRARISSASYLVLVEKRFDETRDSLAVGFQCKVSGVQKVFLKVLEITTVGSSSFRWEDKIVLSPRNKRRRLVIAEEILEFRVQWDIGAVVVEEVHLDVPVTGSVEPDLVERPGCRVKQGQVAHAILVLPARRLELNEEMEARAIFGCGVFPVRLDRIPEFQQPLVVCISVLHNERLYSFRAAQR